MKNSTQHRIERSYGSVQRSIRLSSNVDQSSCNINFENGILTISLTKKPLLQQPQINKIQITNKNNNINENNLNLNNEITKLRKEINGYKTQYDKTTDKEKKKQLISLITTTRNILNNSLFNQKTIISR